MLHTRSLTGIAVLTLLELIPQALSHGIDDHGGASTDVGPLNISRLNSSLGSPDRSPQSYFAYPKHGGLILTHSGLMIIAWFFILPIVEWILRGMAICDAYMWQILGVMLSITRSRLALLVQLSFSGVHSVGLLPGTVYRIKTPNLYGNNAHNKVGWIVTGIILAQCVLRVAKFAASVGRFEARPEEQESILQFGTEDFTQREQTHAHRYSSDSGHCIASESSPSQSISSMRNRHEEEQ